ncbi:MAG: GIY-YIG nuclease family protein [Chloroflexota bacterium]|nr:GIY-YIG nuclease family protein [Chloroflexota bacterium]
MIYAIQRGSDGPIKLGLAGDPNKRLESLQTANDVELVLMAAWDGTASDERALHARFADAHIRGEWFAPLPDLCAFVDERQQDYEAALAARPAPQAVTRHPTWDTHARLGVDELRDPQEWIDVLCDIAPSLRPQHLVLYLELLARAEHRLPADLGTARADLDDLARQAFAVAGRTPDREHVAHAIMDLRRLPLPEPGGPYTGSTSSYLMVTLSVPDERPPTPAASNPLSLNFILGPEEPDAFFIESMVKHGYAIVDLVRYGAGFGPAALPPSYPFHSTPGERWEWAAATIARAQSRRPPPA